jgi:hypothetical protein
MRKCRIYADTNLTPILGLNPLWKDDVGDGVGKEPDLAGHPKFIRNYPCHDYMVNTLHFERMFMVYDGTVNAAPVWCNDDLTLKTVDPRALDWSRAGNFSNPPQKLQVQMCAKLATEAKHFPVSTSESFIPVIFDFENPSFDGTPESIDRMTLACNWVKQVHQNLRVGSYYYPFHENKEAAFNSSWKAFSEAINFVAPSFYPWNLPALHPHSLFGMMEDTTSLLDRFYSHLPRVAVIVPTWQIYWNDLALAPMNGKYIPFDYWQKILMFLNDRGYDLFPWMPGILLDDNAKKYLGEVNKYQL